MCVCVGGGEVEGDIRITDALFLRFVIPSPSFLSPLLPFNPVLHLSFLLSLPPPLEIPLEAQSCNAEAVMYPLAVRARPAKGEGERGAKGRERKKETKKEGKKSERGKI